MLDSPLTADVPLGPFQDKPITVHSARSKNAKLHAGTTCTQLRTRDVTTTAATFNAETIGRMCSRCAQRGEAVVQKVARGRRGLVDNARAVDRCEGEGPAGVEGSRGPAVLSCATDAARGQAQRPVGCANTLWNERI